MPFKQYKALVAQFHGWVDKCADGYIAYFPSPDLKDQFWRAYYVKTGARHF